MRLHSLQYLRAIAAFAVVFSHAVIQVDSYQALLPHVGGFGVDIFFVISGFIMVYIAKPSDTPSKFIVNRIRRVVPLYWFFLSLMAVILIFLPQVFKNTVFDNQIFLQSLFFIPHYSQANPGMVWPLVAPGWSLNYEMYFYLVFAGSLIFPVAWRSAAVAIVITLVFVVATVLQSDSAVNVFYRDAIVFEFLLGMLLAHLHARGFRLSSAMGYALIIAGFGLLLIELPLPRLISFGVPSVMIVAGTLYCSIQRSAFFEMLGDSSYALYLCHIFTLGVCRIALPPLLGEGLVAAYLFVALSLIICGISGIAVHYWIDNWLLKQQRVESLKGALNGSATQL